MIKNNTNKNSTKNLLEEIKKKANPEKAKKLMKFFKTSEGEYAEGDLFLGLTVPESRTIAKRYYNIPFKNISSLIKNKYHEIRLIALLILIYQYNKDKKISKKNSIIQKSIYNFYLAQTKYINNWDLVDLSASYIVGDYLFDKNKNILLKLAKSKNIWDRRIAIVSTFAFIKKGEYIWTFKIAKALIKDKEDLIHKACGWMLREVGKRVSKKKLMGFLELYATKMPRTMLRYSIEHFSPKERSYYLNKKPHK